MSRYVGEWSAGERPGCARVSLGGGKKRRNTGKDGYRG